MGPRMREDTGVGVLTEPRFSIGAPHMETFAKLPKRIQIAVWDDSCPSQIKGFWIPAFAGMTVMQRSRYARATGRGRGMRRERRQENAGEGKSVRV